MRRQVSKARKQIMELTWYGDNRIAWEILE